MHREVHLPEILFVFVVVDGCNNSVLDKAEWVGEAIGYSAHDFLKGF